MDQQWFEMENIRRRKQDNAVWIPLRAYQEEEVGKYGYPGYKSNMLAVGSVAFLSTKEPKPRSWDGRTWA